MSDLPPEMSDPPLDIAVISLHTSPLAQPGTHDSGGMNVYIRELAYAMAHRGHNNTIYVRQNSPDQPREVEVEPGMRLVTIPAGGTNLTKQEMAATVDQFTQAVLDDIAERGNVDVIHAHYWLSGMAGHVIKHELDRPLVTNFHTLARAKWGQDDGWQERAEAEQIVMDCSDRIMVSCEPERQQVLKHYEVSPDRISVVMPGVEHAYFSPGDRGWARQALGLGQTAGQGQAPGQGQATGQGQAPETGQTPVLLFVGRINPLKNPTLAVEALSELKTLAGARPSSNTSSNTSSETKNLAEAQLVIVGGPSGPDGEAELKFLQATAESLGVRPQVRLVPPQSHRMLSSYYRAADVVLIPSHSESFGLVALEAAACGTPVVAADVGGLGALVSHEQTGFLVPGFGDGTSQTYAKFTAQILADPELARELGRNAARMAGRFSWERSGAMLDEVYGSVLSASVVDCLV